MNVRHYGSCILRYTIVAILFYLIIQYGIRGVYGINDDWGIHSVLSGDFLGYPDAHVLFLAYPLSWIISRLYMIIPEFPWYGFFLYSCHMLCAVCMIQQSVKRVPAKYKFCISIAIFLLFMSLDMRIVAFVQFTTTAGICGATAIFLFLISLSEEKTKKYYNNSVMMVILLILTWCIRQNVFYMLIPIGGMIWLGDWLISGRKIDKENVKRYGIPVLAISVLLFLLGSIHYVAYSSQQWKEYPRSSKYRAEIWDFYGWPNYQNNNEKFDKLEISENDYMGISHNIPYCGYGMNLEKWKGIAEIAQKEYEENITAYEKFQQIKGGLISPFMKKELRPLNIAVCFVWLYILWYCFAKTKYKTLLLCVFILFGRMFSWLYILWQGRFPQRIEECLLLVDFMAGFGLIYSQKLFEISKKNKLIKIIGLLAVIVLLFGTTFDKVRTDINVYRKREVVWDGINEYFNTHKDNVYLIYGGSEVMAYWCETPMRPSSGQENFIFAGSYKSADYNGNLQRIYWGLENENDFFNNEKVKVIMKDNLIEESALVQYYYEKYEDFQYTKEDSFMAGENSYNIYSLYK